MSLSGSAHACRFALPRRVDDLLHHPARGNASWLANHPVDSLEQLAEADWIIHERLTSPLRWQVRGVDGHPVSFEIKKAPRLYADSARR